jgi:hypothetical protein
VATYLVGLVIIVLAVRGVIYLVQAARKGGGIHLSSGAAGGSAYVASFVSGVLLTNAVPHFVHGISAEPFPAPFGKYLGPGLPSYAANVLWGFVCIVLGYRLFVSGKVAGTDKLALVSFFAGVLGMGLFLAFVFSHHLALVP